MLHGWRRRWGAEADDDFTLGHFNHLRQAAALSTKHPRVTDADTVQRLLHAFGGAVRIVAVVTEMPENHVMQAWMGHAFQEFSRLVIGKVTVTGADALLGCPRTFEICLKELGIVVGLNEEAVGGFETIFDQVGHKADIAKHAEP